ncbi:unnamed protein product [Echinostoma caproni]|uniref:CUE domain-containing protein n=1 Tax=Echinostoma caproni TaxID=27848 RepID=A0A183AV10_9TREM|nr:unnamed protein product [Echinostoma caproni]
MTFIFIAHKTTVLYHGKITSLVSFGFYADSVTSTHTTAAAVPQTELCVPSTSYPEPDPVDHLAAVFPSIRRSQIREFLDLAAGDIEWASSLILEGVQIGVETSDVPVEGPTSCDEQPPTSTREEYVESNRSCPDLEPCLEPSIMPVDCDPVQATPSDDSTSVVDKSTVEVPTNNKCFSISRQFVREAYDMYGFALGIPPVDLSVAAVPDFLFDEWHPEPELVRGILQSFLRFLGIVHQPTVAGGRSSRSNTITEPPKTNSKNNRE